MSENAYGARPGGEQEGGTSIASGQDVLKPEGSQTPEAEPQGSEQVISPQYLKEMEQRIIEETTRRAQSMTDKMGSRLNKEIESALQRANESIDLSKKAGVNYTPEQEAAIRNQAVEGVYASIGQQSQSQDSGLDQEQQDQEIQAANPWVWVDYEVQRIMSETGVHISSDEANQLIVGENQDMSPYQYIQAFESLAKQRQQNYLQPQGLNPAVPSYVTGGRSKTSKSALQTEYDREKALIASGNHPTIVRGDHMGLQKLKAAYREKGLDI